MGILAGKSTISLVAASLYFAVCLSDNPKPAAEVARVAGCTEATLKNGNFHSYLLCISEYSYNILCLAYRSMYGARQDLMEGLKTPKGVESLPVS